MPVYLLVNRAIFASCASTPCTQPCACGSLTLESVAHSYDFFSALASSNLFRFCSTVSSLRPVNPLTLCERALKERTPPVSGSLPAARFCASIMRCTALMAFFFSPLLFEFVSERAVFLRENFLDPLDLDSLPSLLNETTRSQSPGLFPGLFPASGVLSGLSGCFGCARSGDSP